MKKPTLLLPVLLTLLVLLGWMSSTAHSQAATLVSPQLQGSAFGGGASVTSPHNRATSTTFQLRSTNQTEGWYRVNIIRHSSGARTVSPTRFIGPGWTLLDEAVTLQKGDSITIVGANALAVDSESLSNGEFQKGMLWFFGGWLFEEIFGTDLPESANLSREQMEAILLTILPEFPDYVQPLREGDYLGVMEGLLAELADADEQSGGQVMDLMLLVFGGHPNNDALIRSFFDKVHGTPFTKFSLALNLLSLSRTFLEQAVQPYSEIVSVTTLGGMETGPAFVTVSTQPVNGPIYLDGNRLATGETASITPGNHQLSFGNVNGFTRPAAIPFNAGAGSSSSFTGTYHRNNYDAASFVADVSIPDGTVVTLGQSLHKIWRIRNTGSITWDSRYRWTFDGGEFGADQSVACPVVAPGQTVDLAVNLTAPTGLGSRRAYFRMRSPQGSPFGVRAFVLVDARESVTGSVRPGQRPDGSIDARFARAFSRNGGESAVGRPLGPVWNFAGGTFQDFDGGGGGRGVLGAAPGAGEAYWVHGAIYTKYEQVALSSQFATLGFPISDEQEETSPPHGHTGRRNLFQYGLIAHHLGGKHDRQTYEVHGAIYQLFATYGLGSQALGYPVTDEYVNSGGVPQSNFEGGYITTFNGGLNYARYDYAAEDWKAVWAYQSPHVRVARGRSTRFEVRFLNAGRKTWTRNGPDRVHLGTSNGRDRIPEFVLEDVVDHNPSGWVPPGNRVVMQEGSVPPGSHATFIFWMSPGADREARNYPQYFELVADGAVGWFPENPGLYKDVWWNVEVTGDPEPRGARFEAQGIGPLEGRNSVTVYAGQVVENLWVRYKNLGSLEWQRDGQPFTTLGTSGVFGRNRNSAFFDSQFWPREQRPSTARFTTALTDNHTQPLQSGRFTFHVRAPQVSQPTTFAEDFELVADSDQNWFGESSLVRFYITVLPDQTPPTLSSVTFTPLSPSNAGSVPIQVVAADGETGVRNIEVYANDAPDGSDQGNFHLIGVINGPSGTVVWDTNAAVYRDGTHRIDFRVVDNNGNWLGRGVSPHYYTLDRTAPELRVEQLPAQPTHGEGNWIIEPVTLTLSAPDLDLQDIYFRWDDAPEQRYESSFSVPEGEHTLHAYALDRTGNRSPLVSLPFLLDTGLPETQLTSATQNEGAVSFQFDYSGTDAVTPAASLEFSYRVDEGPWSPWTEETSVTVPATPGVLHLFAVRARDAAGNIDATPVVQPFELTYDIRGRVTRDGAGYAGATVQAGGREAVTETSGEYVLAGLPAGTHLVTVSAAGYVSTPTQQSVTLGLSRTNIDFTLTVPTYSISGRITRDGTGLAGIRVLIGDQAVNTDSTGTFRREGLLAGDYRVRPESNDFTFAPVSRDVSVGPNNGVNIDFAANQRTFSIQGTITSNEQGLGGATVEAGGHSTETQNNGAYTLAGLAPGTYEVTARKTDYRFDTTRTVTLGPDQTGINLEGAFVGYALTAPTTVAAGGSLTVTWSAPVGRTATDWVAFFPQSTPGPSGYLKWTYTGGAATGTFTVTAPSTGGPYVFRYYKNDSGTLAATSNPITLTGVNAPPSVTLDAPGGPFAAPASIPLAATASDMDGTLTRVEFYENGTKLGEATTPSATTSKYEFAWTNVAAGTYTVTARAYDNGGTVTTSSAHSVTVTGSAAIAITLSPASVAAGDTFTLSWTAPPGQSATDWIGFYATGTSGPSGYLSWFYTGGERSGTRTLTAPAAGSYLARYYLNDGGTLAAASNTLSVTGTPASFTVTPNVTSVTANGTLTLSWTAPAGRPAKDWVALVRADQLQAGPPQAITGYVRWAYTNGTSSGSINFSLAGVAPGTYYSVYLLNDTTTVGAVSAPITVTP